MNATASTPRRRPAVLDEWLDPTAIRVLSALDVPIGGRCLDVAAGSGSISRWLARQVGPAGSVVAGGEPSVPSVRPSNVEVRKIDVLAGPPGVDEFDLVYARLVLAAVPGRERALANLVESVRPGGWLVVCDLDWTTCRPAQNTPDFERVGAAARRIVGLSGLDLDLGARLPQALEAHGLEDVEGEAFVSYTRAGEPAAEVCRLALERLRDQVVSTGPASTEDFDRVQARLSDPSCAGTSPTCWTVWGRRPSY
jgi:SAM-dependent methyltransferase